MRFTFEHGNATSATLTSTTGAASTTASAGLLLTWAFRDLDGIREKLAQNQSKHDASFAEAQTVFEDDHALLIPDPDHSINEDRYILLGLS